MELDVQFVDGQLIVVHDYQFDPSRTYPPLKLVLDHFIDKGRLEIELKSFALDILEPTKRLLSKYDCSNIELTSTELPMIKPIRESFPNINVGVIFGSDHYQVWMSEKTMIRKTIELMQTMQAQVAHIPSVPQNIISSELIQTLHHYKFKAHYHIPKVNIKEQLKIYEWCQSLKFDQCTFDDIQLLDRVRK